MSSLMYGWDARWRDYEADGMAGEPLRHAASNHLGRMHAEIGDIVYVVGQRQRRMILIGHMTIDQLVGKAEAESQMGRVLIDKHTHALTDQPSSAIRFDREVPEAVVRALRSERGANVKFERDDAYVLATQALMPMIRLTQGSAALLDQLLEPEPPSEDDMVVDGYRGRGTAEARRAVERRAIAVATEHFVGEGWSVRDVGAIESYDLDCSRGAETLHVEVKGTRGDGDRVELTLNEVDHARDTHPNVALAIVRRVELAAEGDAPPIASGGELTVHESWRVDQGELIPSRFWYTPPPA